MKRTSAWISVALTAGTALPCLAQDRADALRAALDAGRTALGGRGASATVIFADGSHWTGVSGMAEDGAVPVEAATVFEIGSITKTFTAALAVQLASEGVLGLDDPVARWVDDAPGPETITLRQLLRHTSGLADAASDPRYIPGLIGAPARTWEPRETFAFLSEPVGEPGAGFHYSSTGYLVAGLALEAATGRPLDALLRERLFEPLELERTFFGSAEDPTEPVAHPFIDINGDGTAEDLARLIPSTSFRTSAWAAGAILSSSADLARWMRALNTGQVVGPAGWAEMTEWVDRPDGRRYGLGILRDDRSGTVRLGHEGNSAGFSAAAWHLPDEGITVAVLANVHLERVEPVVTALLDVVRMH